MDAATERLFALWTVPPDRRGDPVADFAALYAEPVVVNGNPMPLADLVAWDRALHIAFDQHTMDLVDEVRSVGKLAVAFRHTARHVGPWMTSVGTIQPTGRMVAGIGIDILTVVDGLITQIWVLADELQRLLQVTELRR
jgi:SnoaL-like polyketide cyclase